MNILVQNMVYEIIRELCGRGGFDDWWEQLDNDIQKEIEDDIVRIVREFMD